MFICKQSGRSMIEMLGVLAIIGVLSAGGIMGYSAAMESYKVNKTVQMMADGTAKALLIFEEKRIEGTESTEFLASDLCNFNILPDEICRTCDDSDYCKGYFGETIEPSVWADDNAATYVRSIITPEGTLTVNAPISAFLIRINSAMPVSSCAKIVSSGAWANADKIAITLALGTSNRMEMPLSPGEALTLCQEEMAGDSVNFEIQWWWKTGSITAE